MRSTILTGAGRRLAAALVLFCLIGRSLPQARAGEDWRRDLDYEERVRIAELVRDLDAPSVTRAPVVQALVALAGGPNRDLVADQLVSALALTNPQIREGALETMVRIGEMAFIDALAQVLPFEGFLDNRTLMIRLLPVLLVQRPASRRELLVLLLRDRHTMTDEMRRTLRERAWRVEGQRLDPRWERYRRQVVSTVAGQLDPVGALLQGFDTARWNEAARTMLPGFLVQPLTGSRNECLEAWSYLRGTAKYRNRDFVQTTQKQAAKTLMDMGALRAGPALVAYGRLPRPEGREAALVSLAGLCSHAHRRWEENAAIQAGARLREQDVLNWSAFCLFLTRGAAQPESMAGGLWRDLPAELQQAARAAAGTSATTAVPSLAVRRRLLEHINLGLARSDLLGDAAARSSGSAGVRHRNRVALEAALPGWIRRHRSWRRLSEAELTWRKDEQKWAERLLADTQSLALDTLADEAFAAAPGLQKACYRALGAVGWREAVPVLQTHALRLKTSAAQRQVIAAALGVIGGRRGVRVLEQLLVYKEQGHGATARQEAHRVSCCALRALGQVASRPGDAGASAALQVLLRQRERGHATASVSENTALCDQALQELQIAFEEGRGDLTAREWRQRQSAFLRTRAATAAPRVPAPAKGQD